MKRASSSFPVPDSPQIRTPTSPRATRAASAYRRCTSGTTLGGSGNLGGGASAAGARSGSRSPARRTRSATARTSGVKTAALFSWANTALTLSGPPCATALTPAPSVVEGRRASNSTPPSSVVIDTERHGKAPNNAAPPACATAVASAPSTTRRTSAGRWSRAKESSTRAPAVVATGTAGVATGSSKVTAGSTSGSGTTSSVNATLPSARRPPGGTEARSTRRPSRNVPLLESRSRSRTVPSSNVSSA